MIREMLHALRHPHQFVDCLAERNLETKDELYPDLITQGNAADRSSRRLTRKIRKVRSTDPFTGAIRGDAPRTTNRRRKPP